MYNSLIAFLKEEQKITYKERIKANNQAQKLSIRLEKAYFDLQAFKSNKSQIASAYAIELQIRLTTLHNHAAIMTEMCMLLDRSDLILQTIYAWSKEDSLLKNENKLQLLLEEKNEIEDYIASLRQQYSSISSEANQLLIQDKETVLLNARVAKSIKNAKEDEIIAKFAFGTFILIIALIVLTGGLLVIIPAIAYGLVKGVKSIYNKFRPQNKQEPKSEKTTHNVITKEMQKKKLKDNDSNLDPDRDSDPDSTPDPTSGNDSRFGKGGQMQLNHLMFPQIKASVAQSVTNNPAGVSTTYSKSSGPSI